MNNELKLTDDQLRLATSRSLSEDVPLDNDIAASREAFLSLGASVESAAHNFTEAALLARLQNSCVHAPIILPQRPNSRHDWISLVLTGALAAAALVAMARIVTDSSAGRQHLAVKVKTIEGVTGVPMVPAWNDSLDDEIALASATLDQFNSRTRGFDDSLLDMNDQLQALSQELTTETL